MANNNFIHVGLLQSEAAAGEITGGKIVVYTTSVSTVKETYSACQDMRKIFQRSRVAFEERDIFLDATFNKELQARLPTATVPYAFFNGQPLGVCICLLNMLTSSSSTLQDYETVHKLNENGVLPRLFASMPVGLLVPPCVQFN